MPKSSTCVQGRPSERGRSAAGQQRETNRTTRARPGAASRRRIASRPRHDPVQISSSACDREADGEVARRPVDRGVARRADRPRRPTASRPRGSRRRRGRATLPPRSQQHEDRERRARAPAICSRPDRGVVELEQPVVGARREQQEVRERVGPPLRHQSFSTIAAIMRARIASSGSAPAGGAPCSPARDRRGSSPGSRRSPPDARR